MMEIRCMRQPWRPDIEFVLMDRSNGLAAAVHVVMEKVKEGEVIQPTGVLDATAAQVLMDELWRCGIRPAEGSGSAGSLMATERHLKDMQSIAFGLLKKRGVS